MKKALLAIVAIITINNSVTYSQNVSLLAYLGINVQGIAIDGSGNVYATGNNMVLKINPSAVTTTLAGSPTPGNSDGIGAAASFSNPIGICIDGAGNLFVADKGNYKIRKITPSGVVTTYAGSGTYGTSNATGTLASFQNPTGICISSTGELYVTDQMNFSLPFPWTPKIRKISNAQVVSDFCITNSNCHGLSITNNTLFIAQPNANPGGNSIYYISTSTPGNSVTLYAGTGSSGITNGPLLTATFSDPMGIASNSNGDVYVADNGNHRIRKISNGSVSTLAGNGGIACVDGLASTANFWGPNAVAISNTGDIYVGDYFCQSIRKISGSTTHILDKTTENTTSFELFPNPVSDKLHFNYAFNTHQSIEVTILNSIGVEVYKLKLEDNNLDVSSLESGIYRIIFNIDSHIISKTFIRNN